MDWNRLDVSRAVFGGRVPIFILATYQPALERIVSRAVLAIGDLVTRYPGVWPWRARYLVTVPLRYGVLQNGASVFAQ
jgi:hypothetical protein